MPGEHLFEPVRVVRGEHAEPAVPSPRCPRGPDTPGRHKRIGASRGGRLACALPGRVLQRPSLGLIHPRKGIALAPRRVWGRARWPQGRPWAAVVAGPHMPRPPPATRSRRRAPGRWKARSRRGRRRRCTMAPAQDRRGPEPFEGNPAGDPTTSRSTSHPQQPASTTKQQGVIARSTRNCRAQHHQKSCIVTTTAAPAAAATSSSPAPRDCRACIWTTSGRSDRQVLREIGCDRRVVEVSCVPPPDPRGGHDPAHRQPRLVHVAPGRQRRTGHRPSSRRRHARRGHGAAVPEPAAAAQGCRH